MQITISNYRGISKAEISIDSTTILCGPNGGGKTSTAMALGAALTGEPVPKMITKAQAGVLVRSGTAVGSIVLTGDNGSATVTWPAAKVVTEGHPPTASVYAAGIKNIFDLPDKERVQVLTEYLKANPTIENLSSKLSNILPAEYIGKLWELIEQAGWDGAHAQVKEKGAKLKGKWETITNENYGSKKAESWIPDGWEPGLEGAAETTLKAQETDARDALEAAIAVSAIDDAERERLAQIADLEEERRGHLAGLEAWRYDSAEIDDLVNQINEVKASISKAQKYISDGEVFKGKLPQPKQPKGTPCPKCKAQLEMTGAGTLTEVSKLSDEEIKTRQATIDKTQKNIDDATAQIGEFNETLAELENKWDVELQKRAEAVGVNRDDTAAQKRLVAESQEAAATLAKPQGTADVEGCRQVLATAQRRLAAFVAKTGADETAASITINQEILSALSPAGIRSEVLQKSLSKINALMKNICTAGGWPVVEFDPDFRPLYRGTPYYLCSKAEQWQTEQVVKLALAQIDGSSCVIIDDAERIVSREARGGLMAMLDHVGIPALVLMAYPAQEQAPKTGAVHVYWIGDGGVVR